MPRMVRSLMMFEGLQNGTDLDTQTNNIWSLLHHEEPLEGLSEA